ncbi:DHS-like NAD/FAD-binding domain-containing protein [Xylariaceae sp. FL0255]|nr:DHS-like NAD/FAD-binding domain-containing protein [Xylariaceae sp. FL0255]
MPTLQITPESTDLLQNVADTLAKARKMVIITGAGISTNSGIPDFRSENGLYSLIQEQFDRAEANAKKESPDDDLAAFDIGGRPSKRRRLSAPADDTPPDVPLFPELPSSITKKEPREDSEPKSEPEIVVKLPEAADEDLNPYRRFTRSQTNHVRPPIPRYSTHYSLDSSTSQSSRSSDHQPSSASSQTDTTIIADASRSKTQPTTARNTPKRITRNLASSSPLSSPPPVLFDPFENSNSSTDISSRIDSDSSDASDSEDTQQSLDVFSLHASNSNLRNMKGRDLFDCNIWADPLKTSVFYRFATSLRQRVREVEPTTTHRFIAQMRDVGKLARVYTQNIDEIEKKIGLSTDLKHGAGNKRRKSTKPSQLEIEKEEQENPSQPLHECCPDNIEGLESSQQPDDAAQSKPRSSPTPDKGVECVFLHGSLSALRCFVCGKLCDWDEDGRESCTLSGEQPECPHCAGATAARQEKGKRALGIGKLRPDIVLYGEEHPQSDLISPIVQHDLAGNPDLLLVLGTSLRVHGLKVMVREFAKAVHRKGGKVVFINFTKPSDSAWGDVLDYWIEWDCDAWVEDLKTRKPNLWLSVDEIQELDKQKREALAEKRRETLKKRESINERKRGGLGGEGSQDSLEDTKPRVPPKNPAAMRNDYHCGAYLVYEIFQTLAKIGGRPFDNLGYTSPAPSGEAKPTLDPSSALRGTGNPGSSHQDGQSKPKSKRKRKSALVGVADQTATTTSSNPQSQYKLDSKEGNPFSRVDDRAPIASPLDFNNHITAKKNKRSGRVEKEVAKRKKSRKSAPAALLSTATTEQTPTSFPETRIYETNAGREQYLKAARELARTRRTPTPGYSGMLNQIPVTPRHQPLSFTPYFGQLHPAIKTRTSEEQAHSDWRNSRHQDGSQYAFHSLPILPPPNPFPLGHGVTGRYSLSNPFSARSEPRYQLAPLDWNWRQEPPKIQPMEPAPDVSPLSPLNSFARHQSIFNEELPIPSSNQKDPAGVKVSELTPSPSHQLHLEAAYQLSQMCGRP